MNLATMRFYSPTLNRHVTYNALLPHNAGTSPFPVVLQLHGHGDDESDWLYQSNLARYAANYPFIIVLPNAANSYYLNLDRSNDPLDDLGRQHYETFLINDLRQHVITYLPAQDARWGISGLSMGGYGAMRLGLKYPHLFSSIWSHSGLFLTLEDLTGRIPDPADGDVQTLALRMLEAPQPVEISFDCGDDDELVIHNRRLHRFLDQHNISHTYLEHPDGEHNWEYWDAHIPEALAQHNRILTQS